MDYEQKYKDALNRAREWQSGKYGYYVSDNPQEIAEFIFPELKESDDEKIRKALIDGLREMKSSFHTISSIRIDDAISWLEKQGRQKSIWHNEDEEPQKDSFILLILQEGTPIVARVTESNHTLTRGERWAYIEDLLEKKSGQKLVDKVEPKFKVGDWIVFNGLTLYINEIVKGYYKTISKDGIPISYDRTIDNAARLWTIEEAKDGDVLHLGYVTAIFKKYIGQEKCICYCSFCEYGDFEIPIENGEDNVFGCRNTTPATKEQCDILFQKMKEGGYDWNTDKKRLIKL